MEFNVYPFSVDAFYACLFLGQDTGAMKLDLMRRVYVVSSICECRYSTLKQTVLTFLYVSDKSPFTTYVLDDRGLTLGRGREFCFSPLRPDRLWAPPNLL